MLREHYDSAYTYYIEWRIVPRVNFYTLFRTAIAPSFDGFYKWIVMIGVAMFLVLFMI